MEVNNNLSVYRSVAFLGIFFCLALQAIPMSQVLAGDSVERTYPSSPVTRVDRALLLGFLADNSTLTLIDARSNEEYAEQHLPGAINVPFDAIDARAEFLPENKLKPIVVYCRSGWRAGLLKDALAVRGYTDVRVLPREQIFWESNFMAFNCSTN